MNAEQYQEWKDDPRTVAFFAFLGDYRLDLMEKWASGQYTGATTDQTAMNAAQQMGRAMMLQDLSDLADDAISTFYRQKKGSDDVREDQDAG